MQWKKTPNPKSSDLRPPVFVEIQLNSDSRLPKKQTKQVANVKLT